MSDTEFNRLCMQAGYGDPRAVDKMRVEIERRNLARAEGDASKGAAVEPQAAEEADHHQEHVEAMQAALTAKDFVTVRMALHENTQRLADAHRALEKANTLLAGAMGEIYDRL